MGTSTTLLQEQGVGAYIHEVNPNIFQYFLSFYLCIKLYNTLHVHPLRCHFSHALSGVEAKASYEIIGWGWVYICRLRHTPAFLSSVI